jgi:hypothetical protein
MTERILRAIVPLIPALIIVVCVSSAFAAHGWDVQATLIGEDPLAALERLVPAEAEFGEEPIELHEITLSENGTKLVLNATLHSPLNVPVTIKEIVVQIALNGTDISLRMPEAVTVPAQGTANVRLEGALPEPSDWLARLDQLTIRSIRITVDVSGIELQLEGLELGGLG